MHDPIGQCAAIPKAEEIMSCRESKLNVVCMGKLPLTSTGIFTLGYYATFTWG